MSVDLEDGRAKFARAFEGQAIIYGRAPGRVNIIGEHTDYNGGFVLPMAIDRDVAVVGRSRGDGVLRVYAADLDAFAEFHIANPVQRSDAPWLSYIAGVVQELTSSGFHIDGADVVLTGDVPMGCGLSSSASVEMAALAYFEQANGFTLDAKEAARLGQRVENNFLGLNSGIMDQMIARTAREDHALFLDCRSLAHEYVPVALDETCFIIANTGVERGLTQSQYNDRVDECWRAVRVLSDGVDANNKRLRDFTLDDLETHASKMLEPVYRRARHVITENARTVAAADALRRGDAATLGALMDESDESLRHDYEVTCRELDAMTTIAREHPACYGSRMTGAGFGGCTISLVRAAGIDIFVAELLKGYKAATRRVGETWLAKAASGASAGPLQGPRS